jgi:hypothetical protein
LLVSENWMAGLFRTKVIARIAAFAMTQDSVRQFAFRTLSQTGIRYRQSPLSRMLASFAKGAPVAGDRFPWLQLKLRVDGPVEDLFQMLDDTRFNLIVIGQPAAPAEAITSGSLLSTHVIPADPVNEKELARAQIPAPSFYLLRPDGHVGLAGTHMDAAALTRYLTDHHIRLDNETPGTAALNLRRDRADLPPGISTGRLSLESVESSPGRRLAWHRSGSREIAKTFRRTAATSSLRRPNPAKAKPSR